MGTVPISLSPYCSARRSGMLRFPDVLPHTLSRVLSFPSGSTSLLTLQAQEWKQGLPEAEQGPGPSLVLRSPGPS